MGTGGGIGVLGPVAVDGDSTSVAPRDRVVLGVLVLRRGDAVDTDVFADALWGEDPPASANKVVQGCIARLRKTLGAGAIDTVQHGYRLAVPSDRLDIGRFERLVSRSRELMSLGEMERAAHTAGEALELWRGRPFPDLEEWEPGRVEATRLDELRLDAEELRAEAELQSGHAREVLVEAQRLVGSAPFRERRWALLATAQYQMGRQADALATTRQARRLLAEELGLDPGPDLVELEAAILQQDPSLAPAVAAPAPSSTCPYRGLMPYDVEDSDAYFGRDEELAECLRRLAASGVVVVIGPSGSGKSSLVRAGVGATLRRDGERVSVITPGVHPMDELAAARSERRGTVLVVDQCEEVVTVCRDPDERLRFLDALVDHAEHGRLVVALRADRLGEVSAHAPFARLVERGLYLLQPMDESHLRAAIEGPAHQAGLRLEPGLVDLLVRDVEGEPGALPLLSHALRQTWERREGRTLTVEGYRASGGIRGAVAQTAEAVFADAPPEQRPMLRDLMLRLVAPSPEGEPVRSRVPRRMVATDAEREQVIERLVAARLVTSDEESVELAHEALARAWPRLREWLDDDVEGQRIWRHLSASADAWSAMGCPDSELYRGPRLARATQWRGQAAPDLNPDEAEFLDASERAATTAERAAEDAARRQVRINRRLRILVAGVAVFALIAVAGGVVAWRQAARADSEAEVARSRELAAAAINVIEDDPTLSKVLAVASSSVGSPTLESISALHRAWATDKTVAHYEWPDDQTFFQLRADIDPETRRLVASTSGDYIEVVDMSTGERLWGRTVAPEGSGVDYFASDAYIADGGEYVVSGHLWFAVPDGFTEGDTTAGGGVFVWDAATGEQVDHYETGPCGAAVWGVWGPYVFFESLPGVPGCAGRPPPEVTLELIDLRSGERRTFAEVSRFRGGRIAVSGDRRYVAYDEASTPEGGTVVVTDMSTGDRSTLTIPQGQEEPGVRGLNHDGTLLLYGDRPIQVWDVATAEQRSSFDAHGGVSVQSEFAADGSTVYTNGEDGVLRRWVATTGEQLDELSGVGYGPVSVLGDGVVLVSDSRRGEASLIDHNRSGELGAVATCDGHVPPSAVGPVTLDALSVANGRAVFPMQCAGGAGATTYSVSLDQVESIATFDGQHGAALAMSPDGERVVRQTGEGTTRGPLVVHDATGAQLMTLEGLCTWDEALPEDEQPDCRPYPNVPFAADVELVRWSPDGSLIAASLGHISAVWDAETGRLRWTHRQDDDRNTALDAIFTPDSRQLVVSGWDEFTVLAAETGEIVESYPVDHEAGELLSLVGFSPDGATLYAVGGAGLFGSTGDLTRIDAETFERVTYRSDLHDGGLLTATLSPDATRIATGSANGLIRVWDADSGELVHEIPLDDTEVRSLGFIDDRRLAIAPSDGDLLIVTTDSDELIELVRYTLPRGLRPNECARFNFGDDCPSLPELRGDA